jgi:hypothetical protein
MNAIPKHPLCVCFVFTVVLFAPRSGAQDSQPIYSTLDDSHAALVVGDVKGLIDGAIAVVDLVMPGMSAMIPAQIGGFTGDTEMTGFEPGNGVAAIAFPGNRVVVFAEVAEGQRDTYRESVKNLGIESAMVGDLAVFSQSENGIETGKRVAAEVQETLLEGTGRASLDAYLHLPKILDTYKSEIEGTIASLPELMKASMAQSATAHAPTEGMENIVQAEVYAVYNFVSQLDIFEVELEPGQEGLSLELTFIPKKGTHFARLLTAAKGGDAGNLIRMLPNDGAFRMEAAYDVKAFQDFMLDEMDAVFEDLEWTDEEKADMRKWIEEYMTIYGRGFAGSMFGDSEVFMNGAFIYNVEDPEQSLQLFRQMATHLESSGILDLYKKMGMEMKVDYKENFKEYKEIPIDRMEMAFDFAGMAEKEAEAFLKSFANFKYDLAIAKGYLVLTMGDPPIEGVIDRVLEGGSSDTKPLASKEKFGEGGSFYLDVGLEGYLRMISNVMKDIPDSTEKEKSEEARAKIESSLSALSGAPPISVGLFADTEQANLKLSIPSGLLQKGSQAAVGAMTPEGK